MPQKVVVNRYRTSDGTGQVEKAINQILSEGWRVIPNTHAIYTDVHGWTSVMVFLEKDELPLRRGDVKEDEEKI
jgi:hypothetical protein